MSRPSPRPPRRPRTEEEERRRLFRRMEWVFVYLPPLLILFIAAFGAAFLAWLIAAPEVPFWRRWLIFVVLLIGIPVIGQLLRWLWRSLAGGRNDRAA